MFPCAEQTRLSTPWIITPRPNRSPAVRLICVPPAGGSVQAFTGWSERLSRAEVGIVQLPGRGSRVREPLVQSLSDAGGEVVHAITTLPAHPTVLFGHSFGAVIAFEAARRLHSRSWPVLALFVSGWPAPSVGYQAPPIADLPADLFVKEVSRRYDAIPDALLREGELLNLLIPGLRADFAMAESYRPESGPALACPIIACGGRNDPFVSPADLEGWRNETRGRFSAHLFSGAHHYLVEERAAVTALIANQLSVILAALSRHLLT
jgi:medium-chain acyl-[acyl-carrier-protein] hydrolase